MPEARRREPHRVLDRALQALDPRCDMINLMDIIEERRFVGRLLEMHRLNPGEMLLGPRAFHPHRRTAAAPQKEFAQPMARSQLIFLRRLARSD
jgi:hypothetical protein